ncbi:MAG: LLM class flavin-dependent oxidoreductase, partial [Dehalococcoidia bacterium]
MDIGLEIMITQQHGDIGVLAQRMEELGFESLWLPEHPIIPVNHNTKYSGSPDGSIPDGMLHQVNPFIALARASGTTRNLKLGTAICLVTEHNPLDLAKQISTLDLYSGGRFLLGIGTGWFREEAEI